jgi:hypothetical protein
MCISILVFMTLFLNNRHPNTSSRFSISFDSCICLKKLSYIINTPNSKTDSHDITEILYKVALNTITLILTYVINSRLKRRLII